MPGRPKLYYPAILREVRSVISRVNPDDTLELLRRLVKARRVFVAGQGRSGLMVKAFAQRLMHLGLLVHVAEEITTPRIGPGDVLLACSGSGETRVTIDVMAAAHEADAAVVLLTAAPDGRGGDFADLLIHLPAGTPGANGKGLVRTIQPQRTLFEQTLLLYLDSLILSLRDRLGVKEQEMRRRHKNIE
ncbi:MAG: SIS domain-containing protein [Planctomycetes bacterium]|nr:SIS domain-containing protein [Planctomycetota bacterium]